MNGATKKRVVATIISLGTLALIPAYIFLSSSKVFAETNSSTNKSSDNERTESHTTQKSEDSKKKELSNRGRDNGDNEKTESKSLQTNEDTVRKEVS